MTAAARAGEPAPGAGATGADSRPRFTIGEVLADLRDEFPDVTISKIRYLEDQKLLAPRRTPGGYRLYSSSDVQRLRTILRLQRDEFLPLRVIRQELASGAGGEDDELLPPGVQTGAEFDRHATTWP